MKIEVTTKELATLQSLAIALDLKLEKESNLRGVKVETYINTFVEVDEEMFLDYMKLYFTIAPFIVSVISMVKTAFTLLENQAIDFVMKWQKPVETEEETKLEEAA